MRFEHLGHLLATYRFHRGWDALQAAAVAGVTVPTWSLFERTGRGVGTERIGLVADALGIDRAALHDMADPVSVLGTVWGPGLGRMLRMKRGDEPLDDFALRSGVSRSTLLRWEQSLTHPRDVGALSDVLQALSIDPVEAIRFALWPPRSQMTRRPPLGELLLAERERRELSCRAACSWFGTAMATYHSWERGRANPSPRLRPKVAEFLGITTADVDAMVIPVRKDTYGLPAAPASLVVTRLATFTSREVIAARAGIAVVTLANYENGVARPTPKRIGPLAAGLGAEPLALAESYVGVGSDSATFGQLLRLQRLSRSMTVKQAARLTGVTYTQLSHWEHDRQLPGDERLSKFMAACCALYGLHETQWRAALARTNRRPEPYGVWLSAQLSRSGVEEASFADQVGVSRKIARQWLKGAWRPGPGHFQHIATALGVTKSEVEEGLAFADK